MSEARGGRGAQRTRSPHQEPWRDAAWARLAEPWDLVVIGGGITGAGIFHEAVRAGVKTLLVERRDFAWGTSSRSSKLVHGGLRYLKEGKLGLVRVSVRERMRLLAEAPGLVEPLGFLFPTYRGDRPGARMLGLGLAIYDVLSGSLTHERLDADETRKRAPHLAAAGLTGGFRYGDASTDDARLLLRLIAEAVAAGGTALNHTGVTELLRDGGAVAGVRVADGARAADVRARAVVNATGAWVDALRAQVGAPPRIRRLRGSHLVFPAWRFPAAEAITALHPDDRRPLFVVPWQGATIFGTTDLDDDADPQAEPAIRPDEVRYLEAALAARFPSLGLTAKDAIATYCGVRPVIGSGKVDPSKESREHALFEERGLLTVTGGKLTTFRPIAHQCLARLARLLPALGALRADVRAFDVVGDVALPAALSRGAARRLRGRYGTQSAALARAAAPGELEEIGATEILWAELRWAARSEWVRHLDDLLLRRVRLGILTEEGGARFLPRIRAICQPELGWDDARWDEEQAAYLALHARSYGVPR